ncbi:aminoglycoside O-phosphotransferase [Lentzea sp. NBRC 105346]|uniref:aminoglycoside phosphotransferase family protein n=1 Tax=Lentzea sp. NBRC 105346 TaxID=3032205 RepID=UPI0024A48FA8|nr:aminoglycoside phosphotransferase family protein [Lentzea sp. NBRC 105346]GLZ28345.1 aminoglycoside O-phosphotransferase [Lentzea sp. NBRC 105346]
MLVDELARTRLIRRFGHDVTTWLDDDLPALLDRLAAEWHLDIGRHMPGGTSCTFLADRGGTPVVLKLTPEPDIATAEYRALRAWDAVDAMVGVLDADLPAGALLLEAIEPGTQPAEGLSLEVCRLLLEQLHVPAADGFPPLRDRVDFVFSLLRRKTGRDVGPYHRAAAELALDDVPSVLLHGDLHLGNVLDGGDRGPVAIDPRPCVGDPAVDAVDMVYAAEDHDARIEALSGHVDGDRLRLWVDAFRPFFD